MTQAFNTCWYPATPLRPAYLVAAHDTHSGFQAAPGWRLIGVQRLILTTLEGSALQYVQCTYVERTPG